MMHVFPGAGAALARLRAGGFLTIIVTNQSGIARGIFDDRDLRAIHATLVDQLAVEAGAVDAIYYCPHLEGGKIPPYGRACNCRKPAPGMLLEAANELDIDLADSFMVGNTLADIEAGRAAGCRTLLIAPEGSGPGRADAVAVDFAAAAELILNWGTGG